MAEEPTNPPALPRAPGLECTLVVLRRRARALLVVQQACLIAGCALGLCILVGAADYVLRTPDWLRVVLLFSGAAFAAGAVWTRLRPAVAFAPSLTELALRVEASPVGRGSGLAGVLAAGLELSRPSPHAGVASGATVVAEAERRFAGVRVASLLAPRLTARNTAILAGVLAVLAVGFAAFPSLSAIGARRVLTPWAGAHWPKRTEIADATGVRVHPLGTALPLRVALLKSVDDFGGRLGPGATTIVGKYRVIDSAGAGPVRRVLLESQPRTIEVAGDSAWNDPQRTGVLFERLIEPAGITAGGADESRARRLASGADPESMELEYWFESQDDRTEARKVLLVEPPEVVSASAEITAPRYVWDSGPGAQGGDHRRAIDLGPGHDERAAPPPILAGSRIRVVVELNKPVPTPAEPENKAAVARWLARALGDDVAALAAAEDSGADGARFNFDGSRWTVEWTLRETVRLIVKLVDEHGIGGVDDCSYVLESLQDALPTATVMLPQEDRTVLATAVIDARAEGRDDVGLSGVWLERRLARAPAGSEGAPAEPIDDWTEVARTAGVLVVAADASSPPALPVRLEALTPLDLGTLDLESGDEVWLTALAADAFTLRGQAHEPFRSSVRKLRIISEDEFIEQIWTDLAGIRRAAIALDEEQGRLARDLMRGGEPARLERAQAGVTERLARDRADIERLRERVAENALRDDTIAGVLREAGKLLDEAGKASVDAGQKVKDAAQAEQDRTDPDLNARSEAAQSEKSVQDHLADLIELLDQGEDTWAMRRALQQVLSEQKALRERTSEVSRETTGRELSELSPEQLAALQELAGRQTSLAEQADQAIKDMLETQKELEKKDPAGAESLAEAARRGQRDQVPARMQQAGKQVGENQTNSAVGQQDRVIQSLEEMLESLENAAKNRDEVLRRKLASLIESLEALIVEQERQLIRLGEAKEAGNLAGLDRPMAALHQNTLGVLDEASQGPRELEPVAALIEVAAAAQSTAVVVLRTTPIDADEAEARENDSLEKLREAKALAEKLDQEAAARQTARRRAELKKTYTESLIEQTSLRAETEPLVGLEPTRRSRATARALGERQGQLQQKLADLETATRELSEARVFALAHRRLDEAMGSATGTLGNGDANQDVLWHQDRAVRVLQSIVQALDDSAQKDNDFRNQQQGGGNGQQGGGQAPLVPPVAEIKLLKAMQEEIGDLTRELAEPAKPESADARIDAVARLQSDLAKEAVELVKKLTERGRQAPPVEIGPGEPGVDDRPPGEPLSPPDEDRGGM